jgi:two-component system heavy metal sensor histidine kinase CusS
MSEQLSPPKSIAFKSTVFVGLAVLFCLSVMNFIVIHSIQQHFAEQDADELNVVFLSVQSKLTEATLNNESPSKILSEAVSGHHGVFYHIEQPTGEILYSSKDADFSKYPIHAQTFNQVTSSDLLLFNDGQHMLRAIKLIATVNNINSQNVFNVIVASNMEAHMSYMTKFKRTLWSVILFAAVVTIMAARFAIYKGHSPLRKLTRKIESISADQLDSRLNPLDVPAELSVLVQSFNTMLQRLEDGFERLSYFSADIAHELRTPITNLTTQTQVMLNKPRSNEEYKDMLYSNLEEYDRMTKMVSDMLLLAQTEYGLIKPNKDVVAVNKEIKELLEYFELLADERNIQLVMKGPAIEIFCDRTMLRQALSNLISNAIRYSPNNDKITVKTEMLYGSISIAISNHGEPVAKEHINRLFDRFYRTDPSRTRDGQGAGLGLSIAKSVIKLNGGNITAESSSDKTCFTIIFKD